MKKIKNKLKTCLNIAICIALFYILQNIFTGVIVLIGFEVSTLIKLLFASFALSTSLSIIAFFIIRKKWLVPDKKTIEIKPKATRKVKSKKGHVYIASNVRALGEDVFKIGMTRLDNPDDRIEQLNSTSIPFEFFVHCWIPCDDALEFEGILHSAFSDYRMDQSREFFNISLEEIQGFVQQYTNVLFAYEPVF